MEARGGGCRWAGEAVGVLGAVGGKVAVPQNLVCSDTPSARRWVEAGFLGGWVGPVWGDLGYD